MIIRKTEKYTHLKSDEKTAEQFLKSLENSYSEFKDDHLIIDISEKININIQELLLFLNVSVSHKYYGTSFVIVCKGIDIDRIPEQMCLVPTFAEALDIIEMDAIERDLGF